MNEVFKALADQSRRSLMDGLFREDGQTLSQLCLGLEMSRQAVSKHLGILESAGLVVTHREGREKHHYLNPVPLQEITERWISKYARRRAGAVTALKQVLEEKDDEQA